MIHHESYLRTEDPSCRLGAGRPRRPRVWKQDRTSIMWFGAADTPSRCENNQIVGDLESLFITWFQNPPALGERRLWHVARREEGFLVSDDAVMFIRCGSSYVTECFLWAEQRHEIKGDDKTLFESLHACKAVLLLL